MASNPSSPALVLHVGHDLMLLHTRSMVLKSAGHIVECECAIEAVHRFLSADFDLVLLCHSLSNEEKQRFIRRIRGHGSSTPVLSVGRFDTLNAQQSTFFDEPNTENSPIALLHCIAETLQRDRSAHSTQI